MRSLNSINYDRQKAEQGTMTAVTVQGGIMVGDLRRSLLKMGYMTGKPPDTSIHHRQGIEN